MKLYRSRNYPMRWYAYGKETGWVMFPAVSGGWERRQTARGIDPVDVREVPVSLASGTGMPGSGPADSTGPRLAEAA